MSTSSTEITILNCLYSAGMSNVSVRDLVADYLPESLAADNSSISSRLCKLRGKNLVTSEMVNNVNLWTLTDAGMQAIITAAGKSGADIPIVPKPALSDAIQPDRMDISPDISPETNRRGDVIAADLAAAIEAAEEVMGTELPDFSDPVVLSNVTLRFGKWQSIEAETEGSDEVSDEVSDDLVEEANTLRLRRPLPRQQNALYVMSVLIDMMGRDYPAMAYELTRVAAYIEVECA